VCEGEREREGEGGRYGDYVEREKGMVRKKRVKKERA